MDIKKKDLLEFMKLAKEKNLDVALELTVPGGTSEYIIVKKENIDIKSKYYDEAYDDDMKLIRNSDICIVSARYCDYRHDIINGINEVADSTETAIIDKLIETYGWKGQLLQTVEELSELSVELVKNANRNFSNREHIVEETSDCLFMLKQVCTIFNISSSELKAMEKQKLEKIMVMLNGR